MQEEWRRNKYGGLFKVTNDYMNNKIRSDATKESNKKVYQLTDNQINQVIDESVSQWDDNYARLYMTKIDPKKYLELTATSNAMERIEKENFDLDIEQVKAKNRVADMMYLDIDLETGEIRGHEGRHRAYAFQNAGYNEIDIVVFPYNYEKYNAKEYKDFTIKGQEILSYKSTQLKDLVPVSKANIERIKNRDY